MKRFAALILMLALMITMLAIPAVLADDYATATVKGGWLRLRDGASTDAKTISAYFTGTTVTLLGGSGEWYHVLTPDGKTGYMNAGYLTITGSITGGQVDENTAAAVKSANGKPVRLRSGPSVQYPIIASYSVGTPLTVLTTGSTWSKIRINGRVGYMMNEFIARDGAAAGKYTAYVVSGNGKTVVLRNGPGKTYDVLASYNVGQKVTVKSYGSTWCEVTINGLDGYMMTEFLSTVKPDTSSGNAANYTAYVTSQNGKGVRLRLGAGKLFPTIATYAVGTQATVLEYGEEWCRISIGGNTGYMMTEFLTTRRPSMVTAVSVDRTTAKPGDTLHASVWPEDASVSISWIDDKGKTLGSGDAYYVRQSDAGRKIRASVTGKGATSGTAVSSWCVVSSEYVPPAYELKNIYISDMTPQVGQTLTASLLPEGAAASISWYRDNGVFIGSGASYKVRTADAGYKLCAKATGTGATSGAAVSEWTGAVAPAAAIALQQVTISDTTPTVGDVLTVQLSPAAATASFTWRSSMGHVLGYGQTYTVAADDVGSSIYVYANGTGKTTGSVVSSLTSKVQAKTEPILRVDGVTLNTLSPVVGQTLYVTLDPQTASAAYTWFRDDDKILSTTGYYTVQAEDVGHSLYVWAAGTNGTFGNATSQITAPVAEN